jgi:hypothetical protein
LLGTCAWAGPTRAAELEWSAPAVCGDASSIASQVQQLTQQPLAAVKEADFCVTIELGPSGQWLLHLRTRPRPSGPETVRELSGASCEEAKDAAAVAIAMAIHSLPGSTSSAEPGEAPKPEAAGQPSNPSPTKAAGPELSERSVRYTLGAGLAADRGTLPALAPGVSLEFAVGVSVLRIVAVATLFPAQQARLADGRRGADIGLALGALLLCGDPAVGPFRLSGCAGFEIERLSASSVGVTPHNEVHRFRFGPRAELGVTWPTTSRVRGWIRAGAAFALPRDWFTLNAEFVHKPAAFALRTTLGVEFEF